MSKKTKIKVGDTYSVNDGNIEVLRIERWDKITIRFLDTQYIRLTTSSEINRGEVKDRMKPSVYGIGYLGDTPTKVDGKHTIEYLTWQKMLGRCYSTKKSVNKPSYAGCTVSDNFKYLVYFQKWCQSQVGFNTDGFELDKDLLIKGNKVYSESTCVFLPSEINKALTKSDKTRGSCVIGVSKVGDKFSSRIGNKYLGLFDTEIEAFNAYKEAKESYLKGLAEKWKDKIDIRAYNVLMNYQVEITD